MGVKWLVDGTLVRATSKFDQTVNLLDKEQVIMMNIDYFEQWDRIAQKFDAQEK